jgi:hypothetical protein
MKRPRSKGHKRECIKLGSSMRLSFNIGTTNLDPKDNQQLKNILYT